ncbi:Protein trichome birefringence-like 26 [Ranunculus cassubicifolius]
MVKETRFEWNFGKLNHVLAKFAVSICIMVITIHILYSNSTRFIPIVVEDSSPSVDKIMERVPVPVQVPLISGSNSENFEVGDQNAEKEHCDIFTGDWIPNPAGPVYTNESCRVIQVDQNCMSNGRPDSGYLYWRWKPRDCELARFDPSRFLNVMRNKSWAFIGDSISRNHVQSLLCILSEVEDAIEVYHDEEYKSRRWNFPSYNFTLSVIWSPFLLKSATFENSDGVSSSDTQLYLDELDSKWTNQYHTFDYVVVAGGKWFLKTAIYYENNTIVGCHYCLGRNLTELGYDYGYRKALQLVLSFITTSDHNATVFLRSATPDHFENGEWFSGGTCKRMVPFKEGEIDLNDVDSMLRSIEVEEYEKAVEVGSQRGVNIKLLDTSRMSLLRPDGHPGPYRRFQPFAKGQNDPVQNDCLHWCLPGPIDSWNDLIMQMVVNL